MTTAHVDLDQAGARPAPLVTRAFLLLLLASAGASTSFFLLLSVVPMYASRGGSTGNSAGLGNAVLMLATVGGELLCPRLTARLGTTRVFAAGMVLLGAPALALTMSASTTVIVLVSLVRGLGFAFVVVLGGAAAALLVPAERRGEGLGLYGVACGVPAVVALPAGVGLAQHVGFGIVFVAGAAAALSGVAFGSGLPAQQATADQPAGLRAAGILRPAAIFAATAIAGGVIVTFLPVAFTGASANVVVIGLFAQAAAATLSRWWAGGYGDRHGAATLLAPAVLAAGLGMLVLGMTAQPVAIVSGMVLFGAGFGVAQNASLAMMYDRVTPSGYGTVSAVWNLAYDSGYGIGAAGFGLVAACSSYRAAFGLTAILMLAAVAPARRGRARVRPVHSSPCSNQLVLVQP